jgi:hypothetical protein
MLIDPMGTTPPGPPRRTPGRTVARAGYDFGISGRTTVQPGSSTAIYTGDRRLKSYSDFRSSMVADAESSAICQHLRSEAPRHGFGFAIVASAKGLDGFDLTCCGTSTPGR